MWKQKKTKLTAFLARYYNKNISYKTLWILILAVPLYILDIFCCIQQTWQLHSAVFTDIPIKFGCKTDLNVWPDFLTLVAPLTVSCFVLFKFPWFLFFCVCTFFSIPLLGPESDQPWESSGHKVLWEWGGTGPPQVRDTVCTGSFQHKSTTKTWGNQGREGKQCQLGNKHLEKSLVSKQILDSHLQNKVDFYHLTYFYPTISSQFFPDGSISQEFFSSRYGNGCFYQWLIQTSKPMSLGLPWWSSG